MARGTVKICRICEKEYKYCPSCDKKLPTWHVMFESENCKTIFDILTEYNFGKLTKAEAAAKLSECNLSEKETFRQKIQDEINAIMAKPKRMARPKVEIEVVEEQPVIEEVQPIVEEAKEEPIGVVLEE